MSVIECPYGIHNLKIRQIELGVIVVDFNTMNKFINNNTIYIQLYGLPNKNDVFNSLRRVDILKHLFDSELKEVVNEYFINRLEYLLL